MFLFFPQTLKEKRPKIIRKPRGKYIIKSYKCKVCETIFDTKADKVLHVKTVHNSLKSFDCTECSAKYKSRQGLSDHKILVHEKKKPYKCTMCDQGNNSCGISLWVRSIKM